MSIEADTAMVLNKLNPYQDKPLMYPMNFEPWWKQKLSVKTVSIWSLNAEKTPKYIQSEKLFIESKEMNVLKTYTAYNNKENNATKKSISFASTDIRLKSKEDQERARKNVEKEKEEYERKKLRDEQKKIREFKRKLRPNAMIKKVPYSQKLITNNRY